jgi:penicillin-binding protein 1C
MMMRPFMRGYRDDGAAWAGRHRRVLRHIVRGVLAIALTALLLLAAIAFALSRLGPPPLSASQDISITVLDRNGTLLRAFTTEAGRWRLPVEETGVDPRYLRMLIAYEDARFESHFGVDPLALMRAVAQAISNRRAVSGASTLTMQVARLLEGRHERTGSGKLKQMLRALQLEMRLSKPEILRLYLKLAPFGGNLEGVRAASFAYFGKEPVRLSVAEAALLVALPQAPGLRRPDYHPQTARKARDRVLDRMVAKQVITSAERRAFPQVAAHLTEAEVAADPHRTIHRLTLDYGIQRSLEQLAAESAGSLGSRLSVAILAVDHGSGEVIAHVGSPGYLDHSRFGAIDMVRAVRSPGSTLKPMIYGLAFEAGLAHPDTLIEDRPTRFGSYAPENFDDQFHGTIRIREALQLSLNVPAVKVLSTISPTRLWARLREGGPRLVLPAGAEPSLAMALGGVGLTLSDLAMLYASIARGGETVALRYRLTDGRPAGAHGDRQPPLRLLDPVAAWYLADILRGTPPPRNARGGEIAYKTGTSYGFRDAWAAGFDGKHTVAVWVGRPDGVATPGLTGVAAAAPILFDAFARIATRRTPLASAPAGALFARAGELPPPLRIFVSDRGATTPGPYADPPVAIAFPPDRSELELTRSASGTSRPILLKAEGGVLPLTWMVDGMPIASEPHRREAQFAPEGPGFVRVSVIDAKGQVARAVVKLAE